MDIKGIHIKVKVKGYGKGDRSLRTDIKTFITKCRYLKFSQSFHIQFWFVYCSNEFVHLSSCWFVDFVAVSFWQKFCHAFHLIVFRFSSIFHLAEIYLTVKQIVQHLILKSFQLELSTRNLRNCNKIKCIWIASPICNRSVSLN